MAKAKQKQALLAKTESSYGSDPSPSASVDAFYAYDPVVKENFDEEPRNPALTHFGQLPSLAGMKSAEITFSVELKGSGTPGTAPRLGRLLEACGFLETVNAGVSVVYTPVSTGHESLTIYSYIDGLLHILKGARGNVVATFPAGKKGMLAFTFRGLYVEPTDVALPSITAESTIPPIVKAAQFTLNSVTSLALEQVSIDKQNKVSLGPDMNVTNLLGNVEILGHDPKCIINPEAVPVATYNFRSDWLTNPRALSMVVGSAAGNICTITAPKFNIVDISYGDRDNRVINDITGQLAFDSGNDEVTFTFT